MWILPNENKDKLLTQTLIFLSLLFEAPRRKIDLSNCIWQQKAPPARCSGQPECSLRGKTEGGGSHNAFAAAYDANIAVSAQQLHNDTQECQCIFIISELAIKL